MGTTTSARGAMTSEEIVALTRAHTLFSWSVQSSLDPIAIDRAIAKRPDARWQTAIELGEAIQRTLGTALAEAVPIFDAPTRTTWLAAGPLRPRPLARYGPKFGHGHAAWTRATCR